MKSIVTGHLGIELTQKCNLNCSHCFRGESRQVSITREIIEKIFDEVKLVEILDLSGGEVFLAYDELKMLLEIAKEKGVKILNCSMLTNGTIYDKRIYELLDEYFENYKVAISNDDFHDKSIRRIYGKNQNNSLKPELNPLSIQDIKENMSKHWDNPHCLGFQRVSNHLIKNGRAVNLDTPQKEFEAHGYYYNLCDGDILLVGPMIFIGADGYISDINSEIEKRHKQSLGNIMEKSISEAVISGGIEIDANDLKDFFDKMKKREIDFATHQGDHWIFKDGHMEPTEYIPDTAYYEELNRFLEYEKDNKELLKQGKIKEFIEGYDFERYPKDLSQIEHENQLDDSR